MGNILKSTLQQLLLKIAHNVAEFSVDTQKPAIPRHMGNADCHLLERGPKAFFTRAQGLPAWLVDRTSHYFVDPLIVIRLRISSKLFLKYSRKLQRIVPSAECQRHSSCIRKYAVLTSI